MGLIRAVPKTPIRADDYNRNLDNTVAVDEPRTIKVRHTFDPEQPGAPFTLGPNAAGQVVAGLNADLVDGRDAEAIIAESANKARGRPLTFAELAQMPTPVYVAHRGEPFVAPENTLAAFRSAQMRGAPVIETDVNPSADRALILIHDDELNLYYDVAGAVSQMPVSHILRARNLTAEFQDQHPPLVTDILSAPGRACWHIEVKRQHQATMRQLADLIAAYGLEAQVAVSCDLSAGLQAFREVRAAHPALHLIAIHSDSNNAPDLAAIAAAGVNAVAIAHNANYLDAAFVAQAHALGLRVVVFTVNTRADRDKVIGYGVDEIYTDNYPWVAGLVEPLPLPFTDTFARSVIGTQWTARSGDRPLWKALPSGALSRSLQAGTIALVCVGAVLPPAPTSVRIRFTWTPRQLNADNTRWAGLQFCMQNDIAAVDFNPVTPASGGAYGALLRQNGTMQIDRYDPGQDFAKIAEKPGTGAMVQNAPIQFQINITPTSITFTRLDTNNSVTANDTTYRGGYVALVAASIGGEFSAFSMEVVP